MPNKKIVLTISGIVLAAVAALALFLWKPWEGTQGNDVDTPGYYQSTIGRGNLARNDLVAEEGDWIYYVNKCGDGNIYRISKDGATNELVADNIGDNGRIGFNFQIWDGWLYYCNLNDECISRIRLDGSKRENLPMIFAGTKVNAYTSICVVNEYIFAIDVINDGFYKMNMDGSNVELVIADDIRNYYIYDESIYYTYDYSSLSSEKYEDGIYRMKLDGSEKRKINNIESLRLSPIYVLDGWIYFLDAESYLCRYNLDSNQITILDEKRTGGVNYYNDFILYPSVDNDGAHGIYRMFLDGTEKELIYRDWGVNPQFVDDWVYYYKIEESNSLDGLQDELYRVRIDGTGGEKVTFSP
jgi:hypothetical protein